MQVKTQLRFSVFAVLFSIVSGLAGCGGGTIASPPAPIFASAPVTAATEGTVYTYQITATDPRGGPVSLALTSAPAGATLSGSTITWTPTPAQSRVGNGFTVTATTLAGGTGRQSWTLTPNGTVHISWVDTYWTARGPVNVPYDWTAQNGLASFVKALVPQPDGSLLALGGSGNSDGTFNIPNVPAGYYWLQTQPTGYPVPPILSPPTPLASTALPPVPGRRLGTFWTGSSTFDLGIDLIGEPIPASGSGATTTINLTVVGLDPFQGPNWLESAADSFPYSFGDAFFEAPTPPTFSWGESINSDIDLSRISTIFIGQYELTSGSSFDSLVLGPELTLSDVTITNGAVNNLNGTMTPSPTASLAVSIKGSEWANLFNGVAPAPVTPIGSVLTVSVQPFATDRNAVPIYPVFGPNLPLITPYLGTRGPAYGDAADCSSPFTPFESPAPAYLPSILTDQDLGTIQYGDPFPASWPRVFSFCQKVTAPVPMLSFGPSPPNTSTESLLLTYGQTASLPSSPVSPLVSAVQNAMINGSSFFTAQTLDTAAVTLSWSPPIGAAPYGYYVQLLVRSTDPQGNTAYVTAIAGFGTAKTYMTLPGLLPANTYIFLLTAEVDGRANMETSPNRSALPTAYASVISAPITISSSAVPQVIHGDAEGVGLTPQPAVKRGQSWRFHTRRIR